MTPDAQSVSDSARGLQNNTMWRRLAQGARFIHGSSESQSRWKAKELLRELGFNAVNKLMHDPASVDRSGRTPTQAYELVSQCPSKVSWKSSGKIDEGAE